MGGSQVTADKIIGLLEEFGPAYFLLSQATRITPSEYRRLGPSIRDEKLLHAGEEIPIDADHAPRLNAAIEQIRRETALSPTVADAKAGPGAYAPQAGETSAEVNSNPGGATARAEVASEMKRAEREVRSGLDRYRRLAARRLEAHIRAALAAALHTLAGTTDDLCDDTRLDRVRR